MNLSASIKTVCLVFGLSFMSGVHAQSENKSASLGKTLYGVASYYGKGFHGKKTASGEIFNENAMTAACNVLPMGTWIRVTNIKNKKTVIVKVNDRLHYRMRRLVDMSKAAASRLGYINSGLTRVKIEVLGKNFRQS